jgi:acylphosphatase
MDELRTVRIRIDGRVQGVAFRDWMERTAQSLGLTGWVRNRRDGSVEAVISGDAALVEDMLELCRQGPPAAQVSDMAVLAEEDATFSDFEIRPSA